MALESKKQPSGRLDNCCILINVGMWFERFNIIGSSLQHEYDPASWGEYWPTIVETGVTIGSFGFFLYSVYYFCEEFTSNGNYGT